MSLLKYLKYKTLKYNAYLKNNIDWHINLIIIDVDI